MGDTALSAVKELHPIRERQLIDIIAEKHETSIEDAAYALLRLGGTHRDDPIRTSPEGSVTLHSILSGL